MLAEASTTASILLRAVCQLLPELLGRGPVAARAAELYRPSSYQTQLRVATSPSPGASSGGAPRAREGALEASARLLSRRTYSHQAKEFRKHHGHSKSAEQHRALDVWEVNELPLLSPGGGGAGGAAGAAGPARGHAGFWHVPRVKFALRSSLEVLYLGLLAWVLLRERACVGGSGKLLPACNPTLHATLWTARLLQACVPPCVPEAVAPYVQPVISMHRISRRAAARAQPS